MLALRTGVFSPLNVALMVTPAPAESLRVGSFDFALCLCGACPPGGLLSRAFPHAKHKLECGVRRKITNRHLSAFFAASA